MIGKRQVGPIKRLEIHKRQRIGKKVWPIEAESFLVISAIGIFFFKSYDS